MMISRSLFGMFSMLPLSSGFEPPQYHPIVGGGGGSGFIRSCGAGKVLTGICELATQPVHGIRGRASSLVDALGTICDEP